MLGGGRTDTTTDTEFNWVQLRVEKIAKLKNISVAKFPYKKVKNGLKKSKFSKILSKEILVWK